MAQIQPYVGIDISKDRLDIHIHPTGEAFSLTYDRAGLQALLRRPELTRAVIGCEATGGYEERLLVALSEAGRPALCLHPADIRAFARLKGRRAKTDRLDARAIAEALPIAATSRAPLWRTKEQSELRELLTIRHTLVAATQVLKGHLARMSARSARAVLTAMLAAHQRHIKTLERTIAERLSADRKAHRIRTAPGAGPVLAAEIIAFMPELGTLSSRQAASLTGVAPHPRQSGRSNRKGRCQAGRARVRRVLYMAIISIIKARLAPLYPFYKRLREAGKPAKVAIVAAMRKFIVMLNAMLKTQTDWNPKMAA